MRARQRLSVRPPHDFDVELDVAALEPRCGIQKLDLNAAGSRGKLQRRGDLLRKRAFAKVIHHLAMLFFDALAQTLGRKLGGTQEVLVIG